MRWLKKTEPPGAADPPVRSWASLLSAFGLLPLDGNRLTIREQRQSYERPASFTHHLPLRSYSPDWQCFVFADGKGIGQVLELRPVDAEARPADQLERILDSLENAFIGVPERDTHPWIMQLYAQDEPLLALGRIVRRYAREIADEDDALRDDFFAKLEDHYRQIGQANGVFEDQKAGVRWGGKVRQVRLCLYRTFGDLDKPSATGQKPWEQLRHVVRGLVTGLTNAGVQAVPAGPASVYSWLFTWFNPLLDGPVNDPWHHLTRWPVEDREFPEDYDLAQGVFRNAPVADAASGAWRFGEAFARYLPMTGLRGEPDPGAMMLEARDSKSQTAALFDKLPAGSVFNLTVVFTPQDTLIGEMDDVLRHATGRNPGAALTRETIPDVKKAMTGGHRLYPMTLGVFVRGESPTVLQRHLTQALYALQDARFDAISPSHDLVAHNRYLHHLPMSYQPAHDRLLMDQRKLWLRWGLAVSPLFGSSSGTGRPGIQLFNRVGEPILFDPFSRHDREKTAHTLIFGPSGSGKSALLNYLLTTIQSMYNPHLVIIDVGGSYRLFGQYLARHGKTVRHVDLDTAQHPVPPFTHARQALEQFEREMRDAQTAEAVDPGESGVAERTYIEEMESAGCLIITGGEAREIQRLRRHERLWIRHAIYEAARIARRADRQTMVSDFVAALDRIANGKPIDHLPTLQLDERKRAAQMRDAAGYFLDGFRGRLFNRPGGEWGHCDVTIVDFGKIGLGDDYRDAIALTFIGLMDRIQTDAAERQSSGRMTLVLNDEAHITTTNPLLADYLVKGSKMWRKWGMWLWLATQNLQDFPDASAKILNMAEWWICLQMPPKEIEEIARFRQLSAEEKALMLEARKEPGKYVEGVVLCDRFAPMLFRNVPPAHTLALAQTEQHEKAHRQALMDEHQLTDELDGVARVSEQITAARAQ